MKHDNTIYEREFTEFLEREKHLALMIRSRVAKYGDTKIAVRHKPEGEWLSYSWAVFGEMIDSTSKALIEYGTAEGDMVGIFCHNSVEWAVADYASFTIRAASVPVYATNSTAELEYIVNHAEIKILFVTDQVQYEKAYSLLGKSPTLETIIVSNKSVKIKASKSIMYFADFLEVGRKSKTGKELNKRIAKLDSDDLSTLIYTSGTTGTPKGVMLTHKNWLAMLFGTGYHIPIIESDVNLAFLPLSHVFERAWSYFILCGNGQVDYCHDTKALEEFLVETRPHYMCSVPRVWEKIYAKVKNDINNSSATKQKLFNWALEIGGQVGYLKRDQKPVPFGLRMKHKIATSLVLEKIQSVFGGRTKVYNVGGSAFSGDISEFFFKAGVLLLQGYGLTECFVICVSNPTHNKFGTCGPVVPLVDVRISDEGEIQAKGPNMMIGYYKDEALTKEMFTEDGWLKTGDVGFIDSEGYITITDRIKDLFKTSGGKYVAPQQIETLLKEDFYFEQVAAVGDGEKYVSALIVPAFEALETYANNNGISFNSREDLVKHPNIMSFYQEKIDILTKDLGQVEKIKRFTLLPNEFTQETGELTPTQKIKRKVIKEKYADEIAAMYKE
ncbi:MAG: long-chain fatty acid--CoA ligase [Syntrophomonadaceae bacterium]|nr:long-chain fatty acid--CoA ligase [Syntrophomonadaceae bacterium]